MRALVTGGAGFIGSHTVDLLLENGYSVRVLDSLEPPVHPRKKKPAYLPDDVEFILGDVRHEADLGKALKGVDFVFHLAAHQGYLTDFSTFASVNDVGTALLYQIIHSGRLPIQKVVLASSQATYGEGKYECARDGVQYPALRSLAQLERGEWEVKCPVCSGTIKPLATDEQRVNPHNQYAVSKYCQELYGLTLGQRFNIPTVALRYSITQGPRQSYYNAYSGILRIFAVRLLNGLSPVVYEDGQQLRDYVPVVDVARANLLVLKSDAANFGVFNVGGGQALTVLEYAGLLTSIMGKEVPPEINGAFRFGDTRHIISDIARLKGLGWQVKTPLKQAINDYLEWLQQQPEIDDHYARAEEVMRQQGVIRSVR